MVSVAAGMLGIRPLGSCAVQQAAVYQRRRPERSVAYQVVEGNAETWLARWRAGGLDAGADWVADPLPGAVVVVNEGVRLALANAINLVFVVAFIASALALVPTFFAPRTALGEDTKQAAAEPGVG